MRLRGTLVLVAALPCILGLIAGCSLPNQPPSARIDASCLAGRAPVGISFDAYDSLDSDGHIESCYWNFGDGQTDSGMWVHHRYNTPGTYTVTLTVYDANGASGTASVTVVISEGAHASDFQVTNVRWEPGLCWLLITFPCLHVYVTVQTGGPYPANVELQAIAYDGSGAIVGQSTFTGYGCDIPLGQSYVVDTDMVAISIPMDQVSRVDVRLTGVETCN